MFHESLHTKTSFKDYENSKLKESNNWDFSRGYSPWFWSQIGSNSSSFHFLVFYDVLERKNAFNDNKNKK